eukprot:Skav220734  [mRNA]  locus=scaffold2753:259445:259735:+ [translate_table: standard]
MAPRGIRHASFPSLCRWDPPRPAGPRPPGPRCAAAWPSPAAAEPPEAPRCDRRPGGARRCPEARHRLVSGGTPPVGWRMLEASLVNCEAWWMNGEQ